MLTVSPTTQSTKKISENVQILSTIINLLQPIGIHHCITGVSSFSFGSLSTIGSTLAGKPRWNNPLKAVSRHGSNGLLCPGAEGATVVDPQLTPGKMESCRSMNNGYKGIQCIFGYIVQEYKVKSKISCCKESALVLHVSYAFAIFLSPCVIMPEFAPSGWHIDIHMPITKQIADDTAVPPLWQNVRKNLQVSHHEHSWLPSQSMFAT